jgi:Tfp pilus assembly protein PilN
MKQINLLPKTEQRDLKLQFFSDQLITFWIWVFISLFLFISLTYIAKAVLSARVSEIEGQIAYESQILRSSDNEKLKEEVEGLNTEVKNLRFLYGQHYYWSPALQELSRLLPEDVSIDLLNMDRATGKVDISGVAKKRESMLLFWANVHKSEYFKNINFPLPNLDREENDPFSFVFYINTDKLKKP